MVFQNWVTNSVYANTHVITAPPLDHKKGETSQMEVNTLEKMDSAQRWYNKQWVRKELFQMPIAYDMFAKKRIRLPEDRIWFSEPIYVPLVRLRSAYKMRLCIQAQNIPGRASNYLSVSLYLMSGEYDEDLTWPLKGNCVVALLRGNDDRYPVRRRHVGNGIKQGSGNGHERVIDREESLIWYSYDFISYENLRGFIRDGYKLRFLLEYKYS